MEPPNPWSPGRSPSQTAVEETVVTVCKNSHVIQTSFAGEKSLVLLNILFASIAERAPPETLVLFVGLHSRHVESLAHEPHLQRHLEAAERQSIGTSLQPSPPALGYWSTWATWALETFSPHETRTHNPEKSDFVAIWWTLCVISAKSWATGSQATPTGSSSPEWCHSRLDKKHGARCGKWRWKYGWNKFWCRNSRYIGNYIVNSQVIFSLSPNVKPETFKLFISLKKTSVLWNVA